MCAERLDRILCNSGFGSRKDVRKLIKSNLVTVNDSIIKDFDAHIDISTSCIKVEGIELNVKTHKYIMLNKPHDYVCSAKAGQKQSVFELIKEDANHKYLGGELSLVGRLDIDTEGLIFITTDGVLNHKLTSPKYKVPKTYLVYLRDSVEKIRRQIVFPVNVNGKMKTFIRFRHIFRKMGRIIQKIQTLYAILLCMKESFMK